MTTTVETTVDLDCKCGDGRWSHKRGSGGCRVMDCPCDKYLPPKNQPAPEPAVEESVVAAALGELHVLPADEPAGPVDPVEVVDVVRRRRREPAPLPGGDPEPDPAAQAEHAQQVAAIDAQLAQPEPDPLCPCASDPTAACTPGPLLARPEPKDLSLALEEACGDVERLTADRDRLSEQLGARLRDLDQAQTRVAQLERNVRALTAERNDERTANAALHRELAEEQQHAAREQGARSAEIAQLRAELDRAAAARQRLQGQLDQAVHTGLNAASQVIGRYTAHACLTCGARYGKPYTDHACGPLVPVVVTIARADRPGPAPTEGN